MSEAEIERLEQIRDEEPEVYCECGWTMAPGEAGAPLCSTCDRILWEKA